VWKRYGFVDAFNHTGWMAPDVIGIDVGITLLMAENAPWPGQSAAERKSPRHAEAPRAGDAELSR
jgi:hypothetical protein